MIICYRLEDKTPIPEPDMRIWSEWFETAANRIVVQTQIDTDELVSTVFLGVDHGLVGDGPPILFETMVFGGNWDLGQRRYSTWDEAEEGHRRVVDEVMGKSRPGSGLSNIIFQ